MLTIFTLSSLVNQNNAETKVEFCNTGEILSALDQPNKYIQSCNLDPKTSCLIYQDERETSISIQERRKTRVKPNCYDGQGRIGQATCETLRFLVK